MNARLLLLALVATACDSVPLGPLEENERLAVIRYRDEPVSINVPEVAEVGEDVTISVRTYAVVPCSEKGRTHKVESGSKVILEFVDSIPAPVSNSICSAALEIYLREETLVFSEAGTAEIQVRGREWPEDELVTEKRKILVQ